MKPSKENLDEEEEAFLQEGDNHHASPLPTSEARRNRWRASHIVRLVIEFAMASAIVVLLVRQSKISCLPSPLRRTPVPQCMQDFHRRETKKKL